jgi:hypothetical protein
MKRRKEARIGKNGRKDGRKEGSNERTTGTKERQE